MIETIMVFAIGVLAAALLALLILPGLSRRAERLARRRVEARLPTSVSQIAAERDLLRAELAVQARRVEIRAEGLAKEHAANLLELGRRDVELASGQAELAARSQALAMLEAAHAALTMEHNNTVAALAETSASLSQTRHELGEREAALAALTADHRSLSETAEQRRLSIAGLETTAEGLRIRIGDLERDVANRTGELTAAGTTLAEKNTQIAVQEHKIAALTHEKEERDRLIDQLRTDLASAVSAASTAERASGDLEIKLGASVARAELAEGELEKARRTLQDVEAELATAIETVRAEKAAAAGSLEEIRLERRALEHELDLARRSLQSKTLESKVENEELRKAIDSVTAQIIASVAAGDSTDPVAGFSRPERRKVRLAAVERRRSEPPSDVPRENSQRNQKPAADEAASAAQELPALQPSVSQG